MRAFRYYKKNCMSVEVIKDNYIQKVNFRVRNKNVVREEVKEKVKWNVDRTSPSNKLRDFMDWSRVILQDALYQRKVLKNPILRVITAGWMMWNNIIFFISLIMSILFLVGKTVPVGYAITVAHPINTTAPASVYSSPASIWMPQYSSFNEIVIVLGFIHNVFSVLVLVTYFISSHPSLPPIRSMFRSLTAKRRNDGDGVDMSTKSTKVVSASLISSLTAFYLLVVIFSFLGSFVNQYFFAFHLLNIANNNPTLQGVIRAVTQNGVSLLWVAVLGIIIMFYFTIIGFTFLQSGMDHDNLMFCDTLAQCLFTVIRFGIVADLLENAVPNSAENTFGRFGQYAVFHITFYIIITVIGLNLIFGIIVDTFSELRDLKWQAEADMRDTCFICSRANFEFEHSGKGFSHHVEEEHNMWAYIFFFIHLQDTKANDYTSIELYVHNQLQSDCYDFFPFNRSLCLSSKTDESDDSKFDKLLKKIKHLQDRQHQEVIEKRRFEEMERQRRWRGKFGSGSRRGGYDGDMRSGSRQSIADSMQSAPEFPRIPDERTRRKPVMEADWAPPEPPAPPQTSYAPPPVEEDPVRYASPAPSSGVEFPSPPPPEDEGSSRRSDSPAFASYDLTGRRDSYPSDDPMRFLDDYEDGSHGDGASSMGSTRM